MGLNVKSYEQEEYEAFQKKNWDKIKSLENGDYTEILAKKHKELKDTMDIKYWER